MTDNSLWPTDVQNALNNGRFDLVLEWIDTSAPKDGLDTFLLKASVYDWWGKPLDAVQVLTSGLKGLAEDKRWTYLWYRGLMYIQANMPALAEQDFDAVLIKGRAHPELTRLARAYAKMLMGDARGALEDIDGLPSNTVLSLDRVITPDWLDDLAHASLRRRAPKEGSADTIVL